MTDVGNKNIVPVDIESALKDARNVGIVVIAHEGAGFVNINYDIEVFNNEHYGAFNGLFIVFLRRDGTNRAVVYTE